MANITTYHNNTANGLTIWNSDNQAYYLVPFAHVAEMFNKTQEVLTVPQDLINNAFDFLSVYDPETEIVLLTLNEDIITVAIVRKDLKPSREAIGEILDWPLDKVATFIYLNNLVELDAMCDLLDLTEEEYDQALGLII